MNAMRIHELYIYLYKSNHLKMKRIIVIIVLTLTSLSAFAQNSSDGSIKIFGIPVTTESILTIIGLSIAICEVLINSIRGFVKKMKENKAPLSGIWEDEIYDRNGTVIKRDLFYLKQNGDVITGTAKRFYPKEEVGRHYEVYGKIVGNDFIAVFWSTIPVAKSYGSWLISVQGDNFFKGHYLRLPDKSCRRLTRSASLKKTQNRKKIFRKMP